MKYGIATTISGILVSRRAATPDRYGNRCISRYGQTRPSSETASTTATTRTSAASSDIAATTTTAASHDEIVHGWSNMTTGKHQYLMNPAHTDNPVPETNHVSVATFTNVQSPRTLNVPPLAHAVAVPALYTVKLVVVKVNACDA